MFIQVNAGTMLSLFLVSHLYILQQSILTFFKLKSHQNFLESGDGV